MKSVSKPIPFWPREQNSERHSSTPVEKVYTSNQGVGKLSFLNKSKKKLAGNLRIL